MKLLVFSFIILAFTATSVHSSITAEEVLNVTAGILEGFFHEESLTNLEECIKDVDTLGYDLYDAIEDFIAGDFDHVRDGISHIGDAIEVIADGMKACKDAVEEDWEKLVQIVAIFKSPASLIVQIGKDILLNHRSIKKDI